MKSYLIFTGAGTKIILTSYDSVQHPQLLKKLKLKGITKFIAYQVSLELTRAKYGDYFDTVSCNLGESDDLKVIDYGSDRLSSKFSLDELNNPTFYEPQCDHSVDIYMVGV